MNNSENGQSIVEVIIATVITSMILVGLISAITYSLSNSQFAKNKALANKHGQEAIEWLRAQRDISGWTLFYGPNNLLSRTHCINSFPATITSLYSQPTGNCTAGTVITGTIFTRQVQFIGHASGDRISIKITLLWPQGKNTSTISLDTFLTRWQ
mgnify:CR=1 FL=1